MQVVLQNSTNVDCSKDITTIITPIIGNGVIAIVSGIFSYLINRWHHRTLKTEFNDMKDRIDNHSTELQTVRGRSPHEPIDMETPSEAQYSQPFPFRNVVDYQ
jgi:hypothetical protein